MFTDNVNFLQKAVLFHPRDTSLLLLKRRSDDGKRSGEWDLPGGNVNFGEGHEEAILREVHEETGIGVSDLAIAQVATGFSKDKGIYHIFIGYSCKARSDAIRLCREHETYRWVSKQEAGQLLNSAYLRDLLETLD